MWLIPLAVLVLAMVKTWSPRAAFSETAWFSAGWLVALAAIYLAEKAGFDYLSTSPTGMGGIVAMLVGFGAMWYEHRRFCKRKAIERAAKEAERARRAAAGQSTDRSVIVSAFRAAGAVQRARRNARTSK